MKVPDIFIPEKNLEGNIKKLLKESQVCVIDPLEYCRFKVISANNYAEGIVNLKEQGKKPFTFYENIKARIVDYEVNGGDAELFGAGLDSVTGVAYKAKSTKFKLVLRSKKLENISDLGQDFVPINYDAETGIELDSLKGKYGQLLTREEVKNHEFWLAAMNGNKDKLEKYVDIWFDKTGRTEGMGVYLKSKRDKDELRGLALYSDGYYSGALGYCSLYGHAHFVSGAQQK